MSGPSLDLFWPRDVVGRVIGEHPMVADGGRVRCHGCGVVVTDSSQHVMRALLAAVQRLRSCPPEASGTAQTAKVMVLDPRESQISWGRSEPPEPPEAA
jgi:predicted nucleic acid-binding Zn ribbon protein